MRYLFNSPLGTSISGVPISKHNPALIAAGMVASGMLNAASQESTNEANASMDLATRKWQSEENEKARQWQEKQWKYQFDTTNQYNTPSAQMQRYKEAGLNPYMHINGQVGSGTSSGTSVGSPGMASTPGHSVMQAPQYGAGFTQGLQGYLQASSVDANVANQSAQTDRTKAETARIIAEVGGYKQARGYLRSQLGVNGEVSTAERLAEGEIASYEYKNEMQKIQNSIAQKYGDRQAYAILSNTEQQYINMVAEVGKMASDVKVNDANIEKIHAESRELASRFVRNIAEAYKLRKEGDHYVADTETINAIRSSVTAMYRSNASVAEMNATERKSHFVANKAARDWLGTDDASDRALNIMKMNYNDFNYILDKSIHAISPLTPSESSTTVYQGGTGQRTHVSGF